MKLDQLVGGSFDVDAAARSVVDLNGVSIVDDGDRSLVIMDEEARQRSVSGRVMSIGGWAWPVAQLANVLSSAPQCVGPPSPL